MGNKHAKATGVLIDTKKLAVTPAQRGQVLAGVHYILGNSYQPPFPPPLQTATFAAGCFWGTEKGFWRLPGVYSTAVGYIAGRAGAPATYKAVCSGQTGFAECTYVVYDPNKIAYTDLLRYFWSCHDPTQGNGQGNDRGTQYRSGLYADDDDLILLAEASKKAFSSVLEAKGYPPITTEVKKGEKFFPAELYHQQYLAIPGNRQYCSAEPTGVAIPWIDQWDLPDELKRKHQPKLPPAFWKIFNGTIRAPNEQEVWVTEQEAAAEAAAKVAEQQAEAQRTQLEKDNVVIVRYCGGCGYAHRAEEFVEYLKQATGIAKIGLLQDNGTTGNFDVRVKKEGAGGPAVDAAGFFLVHSKKGVAGGEGDGFVDTAAKVEAVLNAIAVAQGVQIDRSVEPPASALSAERGTVPVDPNEDTNQKVHDLINNNKIMIFSRSDCPYCALAKAIFDEQKLEYTAYEVDAQSDGEKVVQLISAQFQHDTTPAVFIKGMFVGGSDSVKMAAADGTLLARLME